MTAMKDAFETASKKSGKDKKAKKVKTAYGEVDLQESAPKKSKKVAAETAAPESTDERLVRLMKAHDWHHAYSDDSSVYKRGEAERREIDDLFAVLVQEIGEEAAVSVWDSCAPEGARKGTAQTEAVAEEPVREAASERLVRLLKDADRSDDRRLEIAQTFAEAAVEVGEEKAAEIWNANCADGEKIERVRVTIERVADEPKAKTEKKLFPESPAFGLLVGSVALMAGGAVLSVIDMIGGFRQQKAA